MMKKYLLALTCVLGIVGIASANSLNFSPSFYLSGSTATSSAVSVSAGVTRSFVIDAFSNGETTKFDEGYLLTQVAAATISSTTVGGVKVGITVSYSMDGVDYFVDNTSTSTTANPVILGDTPQYTFAANVSGMGSSTRMAAIKVTVPTRYIKVTFSPITATSSVWAQFVPVKQSR